MDFSNSKLPMTPPMAQNIKGFEQLKNYTFH